MKKLIATLLIFTGLFAEVSGQIVLIDDIAPKNDAFDVIVDIEKVGDANTDSTFDSDADKRIDPRWVVQSVHSNFDGYYVRFDNDGDSLYLDEVSGGGGADADSIRGVEVSDATPAADEVLIYDSDSSRWIPGTSGGGGDVTDVVGGDGLVDDGNTGSITLDLFPGWGITIDNDSAVASATELDQRYFTESETQSEINDSLQTNWATFISDDTVTAYRPAIHDSLDAHWSVFTTDNNDTVTAYRAAIHDSLDANWATFTSDDTVTSYRPAIHDSLDANWATLTDTVEHYRECASDTLWAHLDDSLNGYLTTAAVQAEIEDSLNEYLLKTEFNDSVDAVSYLDSSNITDQSLVPDDIDTTDNDFVFSGAYKQTSAETDSEFVTYGTMAGYGISAGWPLTLDVDDSLYIDSTDIVMWNLWSEAYDSVDAWGNKVNEDDTVTSYRAAIEDSLAANWTTFLYLDNGTNPTTDAEGEIAWDSDDDAIEVYSGDEAESGLIPFYRDIQATIWTPDNVNDTIVLFHVDALLYPHGIEIDQSSITIRGDAAYTLTLAEYSSSWEWQATTDSVVQASGYFTEDSTPMDATLDADDYLTACIPSTDVDQVHIKVIYHVKEGD